MPLISPALFMLSPEGNEPLGLVQVYGGEPPVAAMLNETDCPTTSSGRGLVVVICSAPNCAAITRVGFMLTFCAPPGHESVAIIPGVNVPNTVGVPETRPAIEMPMPCGNPLPVQLIAPYPPVDCSWKLYATFCVPLGNVWVEMLNGGQDTVRLITSVAVALRLSVT